PKNLVIVGFHFPTGRCSRSFNPTYNYFSFPRVISCYVYNLHNQGGQDFGVSATSLLRLRQRQRSVQVSRTLPTPQPY
ncbi:MAG: hypothetical protein ACYTX0_59045, partial [Nostoc sp.]